MAKFVTGNELNHELSQLLDNAEGFLLLISPYIKLHDRYASSLLKKIDNPKLEIVIVFGKNEEDLSKSMKKEDFDFFKKFPNIEIRYEKRLHAKFYANEVSAILTSMNLYSFSQDNNIEAGVVTKTTFLGDVLGQDKFESQTYEYFNTVIDQSKLLFSKVPKFDNGKLGIGLGKKYLKSDIEVDLLTDFFENKSKYDNKKSDKQKVKDNASSNSSKRKGYCIRTGIEIPFDIKKPMSNDAYKVWEKFGDPDYAEKYCHFSGEESKGETSVARPILKRNWRKSKG